jgi:HEAT repeat protein
MNSPSSLRLPLAVVLALVCACAAKTKPEGDTQGSPPAATPENVRAKVEALLAGYEYVPTAEDWKKLGPVALKVLDEIYANPKELPTKRSRAVASMGQVDHPEAARHLSAIMKDTSAPSEYRSTAVAAYAHREGPAAVTEIEPMLGDSDKEVRRAAIKTIGKLGGTSSRKALEQRLEVEEDEALREAIQRSLTQMEP